MMNTGIKYKQHFFVLKRHIDETDKSYLIRQWFVALNLKKYKYDKIVYLSDFYVNVKLNNIKYNEEIMKELSGIEGFA